ncbi:Uncharacterised protein [uncultured archaeon]|nr:Uncharacterised protein [uncultured archaeon]
MKTEDNTVKEWLSKLQKVKAGGADLSAGEDLSIAIMNLVSLEEHFYFSAMKTNEKKYLDMLYSVRELRKTMLKKIVKDPKGEEWCISKHLLAASMRLIEVGTKELTNKNKAEAEKLFAAAYELYSLFWAINLNLAPSGKIDPPMLESEKKQETFSKMISEVVNKLVDCCRE